MNNRNFRISELEVECVSGYDLAGIPGPKSPRLTRGVRLWTLKLSAHWTLFHDLIKKLTDLCVMFRAYYAFYPFKQLRSLNMPELPM